ncbi:MAG: Rpn family recombination-promoting nuclease/putative transposase [Treponema sp.]|uniref:Rpn family recombination-promoting nuclease/putative transposase n=1 Tax=Treponema sp. TaxID=166 RepID=UPI00298E691A|nr:Rpn family recombination-promoting nuclease/putative transposase [Treponema sp.]MDD5810808.1 Rpn family recombination-promoting nuclease/putative transposase [Treponema sp.]
MKPWNELKITDDYIFCKVMQNESICRQMLELLLHIKIDRLEYVHNQYAIAPDYGSHSIRLDVYVRDSNKIYDIEIQTTDKHNLEKRVRYYQALMDIDQLERSMDYRHLKESYVIFICTFDPFNHDSLIYTVKQNFLERPDKSYDDNTRKVFYNLNASELKREDSRLGTFLRYLITNDPEDVFTKQISKEVESVKHSTKWRKEYMTVGEWIREEVEKEVAIEIDKRVATEVDKRVASEVDKRVANEVEKRVSNEVEKQVAIKLEKEVNKKVATEVENQLHAQQLQNARNLLAMNVLTAEQIAQAVELPVEEVLSLK